MSSNSNIKPTNSDDSRWLVVFAGSAAFLTYLCMYAFRKPFTAATYDSLPALIGGVDFKTTVLIAQVVGYALSKLIGVKVVSEMQKNHRAMSIILLIVLSWLALALLPILPMKLKFLALFLNGLPLGIIWGIVFSFLEGRRITEAAGALLCVTFVLGSGLVKSIGSWLMVDVGISDLWMPFTTGGLFLLPLVFSVFMLTKIPDPTIKDISARQERVPLDHQGRWAYFKDYWLGFLLLVIVYTLLTTLRDFSDSFAAEIWASLGYRDTPSIFTIASIPVSLIILVALALLVKIQNNVRAVMVNHSLIALGFLVVIFATFSYQAGLLNGPSWFVVITSGLYLSYVPFNCMLFERLVAATQSLGNAGFLIYLADSSGYVGSVAVLISKSIFQAEMSWELFLINACYGVGFAGIVLISISSIYFKSRLRDEA